MKCFTKGKFVPVTIIGTLLMLVAFSQPFAAHSDQFTKDIDQAVEAMGQDLQEQVAVQLQQSMDAEIVLSYKNYLALQVADNMNRLDQLVSIEPYPVLRIAPGELIAEVDLSEDKEDC